MNSCIGDDMVVYQKRVKMKISFGEVSAKRQDGLLAKEEQRGSARNQEQIISAFQISRCVARASQAWQMELFLNCISCAF